MDVPGTAPGRPGRPAPWRCPAPPGNGAAGRASWTPARKGSPWGAGGRVRHGPALGLLPAPGTRYESVSRVSLPVLCGAFRDARLVQRPAPTVADGGPLPQRQRATV